MYLATCNRVEVLVSTSDEAEQEAGEGLKNLLAERGGISRPDLERCLYFLTGVEAVRHIFRVASSLDSLVMGEAQILGQVKDAYREAVEHGATGVLLNRVMHHTFQVAKRVRTETGIADNAVSVGYAAVELAKKIFGRLDDKAILLVGAGEMSELAARHLLKQGISSIFVANRTYARAQEIADLFQGTAVTLEQLPEVLKRVDIVISSTGSPDYVVTREMVAAALHRRKNRFLFLIDIAVPRDIEPAAGDIDNVYLYNIDHLQELVDENRHHRRQEAGKAEVIIEEELRNHEDWLSSLEVVPTIVEFREKIEGIVKSELEKASSWRQALSESDQRHVEGLISSIVNKILHEPTASLREESRNRNAQVYVAALRRLFKMEK
ncbi:MAG: Glutamyl-tRNA reductase [Syntrophus sp. PtaB.Bin001]|nr:MAG: Glutamyl-tRNA reductase [Syntrophus sp. PtaB.Bin001]